MNLGTENGKESQEEKAIDWQGKEIDRRIKGVKITTRASAWSIE